MENIINKNITIVYCSCDKYRCLWSGFFKLLKKYFPDYAAPIVLNTETETYCSDYYTILRPEQNMSNFTWSKRLLISLDYVKTPYVLLWLDDFYLKNPVRTDCLEVCLTKMRQSKDIKLVTFGWQPGKNKNDCLIESFERRGRFSPYRINAQIGLWDKTYLKKIINPRENPWQFELNGSFRSSIIGGKIYSLKKTSELVFDYDWGFLIIRGKINKRIASYFAETERIDIDFPYGALADTPEQEKISTIRHILQRAKYLYGMITHIF